MPEKEVKKVSSGETSSLERGHIVDNGEKVRKNPDLEDLWRRQTLIIGKLNDMEDSLKKIERNTRQPGGAQPRSKFSREVLTTERAGQEVLTDLGKDLKDTVDEQGELEKDEFKKIMRKHDWTASTDKTYRNWMEKVAAHFDAFEFEVGERGGRNRPSRIVWDGY
ncbi:MAG: hypothetical protein ABEJ83_03345 [Candidatus Nanohaloarchaea archaeon]